MHDTPLTDIALLEAELEQPTVSVVIPTLNEADNLEHVFERIPDSITEVILVDGHSDDDTVAIAQRLRPDVKVVHQNRRGKGNALACGFDACEGDIVVMIDADGSTDAAEIPRFVSTLQSGADFAKGSRFLAGGHSHDITRVRRAGNWALNTLANRLFNTRYSDLCYGYNAFWRRLVPHFDLDSTGRHEPVWGDGFEIETLLNVRTAVSGATITEVPSVEHQRIHGESKLNTWSDGWRVLRTLVRERRRANNGGSLTVAGPRQAEFEAPAERVEPVTEVTVTPGT
jgi:glycosyltransferase involved in cell wall biosynthesis